jgi:hypothetical protein
MSPNKWQTALLVLGLCVTGVAGQDRPAGGFDRAEFDRLKPALDVKNQPWTTIPWKYSITEARRQAAATKKPIFMVVNTGNALGCV